MGLPEQEVAIGWFVGHYDLGRLENQGGYPSVIELVGKVVCVADVTENNEPRLHLYDLADIVDVYRKAKDKCKDSLWVKSDCDVDECFELAFGVQEIWEKEKEGKLNA